MICLLDLFSGGGGFSLAAEWAGIKTVAFCEIEPFCCKVLEKRFPGVPIFGDIKKLTKETYLEKGLPLPDIVCGGFPCQPFSVAGKRKGKEDDRFLWPHMLRVIGELRPRYVIGENVAGLAEMVKFDSELEMDGKEYTDAEKASGLFSVGEVRERVGRGILDEIMEDLKKIGYSRVPNIIPACSLGAPHRRDRIWIIAKDTLNDRNRIGKHGK